MPTVSHTQRSFEIFAVLFTATGKFIFMDWLNVKLAFISTAIIFWVSYVVYQSRKQPGILAYWGFTKVNFFQTFQPLLWFGLLSSIAFIAYAFLNHQLHFHWHLLVILLIYPLWGIIQQYLTMSLVGGNLKDAEKIHLSDTLIILITSAAFGLLHLPVLLLAAATFGLALVYSFLFLQYRNLWPLGLFHGWLGALFYFFVLNRDPWVEVFG